MRAPWKEITEAFCLRGGCNARCRNKHTAPATGSLTLIFELGFESNALHRRAKSGCRKPWTVAADLLNAAPFCHPSRWRRPALTPARITARHQHYYAISASQVVSQLRSLAVFHTLILRNFRRALPACHAGLSEPLSARMRRRFN